MYTSFEQINYLSLPRQTPHKYKCHNASAKVIAVIITDNNLLLCTLGNDERTSLFASHNDAARKTEVLLW